VGGNSALDIGPSGIDTAAFCSALERVRGGGTELDPDIVALMLAGARRRDPAIDSLTPRRREVLALMAQGRTNAAIARRLSISDKAVVRHVSNIYDVLGLIVCDEDHRRVLAVLRYLAH
jgi:DNA-binding NarL/FixJ family response regulator